MFQNSEIKQFVEGSSTGGRQREKKYELKWAVSLDFRGLKQELDRSRKGGKHLRSSVKINKINKNTNKWLLTNKIRINICV